jgi:hypothetical protein
MQTFLISAEPEETARILDHRRLGKQRVEAFQIIKALRDASYGWQDHPAVRMWRGYEPALGFYMNVMIDEWVRRGYRNTMQRYPVNFAQKPQWMFDSQMHASHRSNLLRKDPNYYGRFGWTEKPDMPYYWPVRKP